MFQSCRRGIQTMLWIKNMIWIVFLYPIHKTFERPPHPLHLVKKASFCSERRESQSCVSPKLLSPKLSYCVVGYDEYRCTVVVEVVLREAKRSEAR